MNSFNRTLSEQEKVKCFGSKAAICVEGTILEKEGVETINLEIAPRQAENVDWSRKIVIQLSTSELPQLCAVLMGYLNSLHLKRPGKGIEIERQKGHLYLKASAGMGNMFVLPVQMGDAFRITALSLKQLVKQSGLTDETLVLAALRGCSSLVN
jgi:hypothetical protein